MSVECSATNRTMVSPPPEALRHLRKSGRKDCKSQRLEKPRARLSPRHDGPPELPAAMAAAHNEVSQQSSMVWEGVHDAPLDEGLWTVDDGRGRESQLALRVWPLVGQRCSSGGAQANGFVDSTN